MSSSSKAKKVTNNILKQGNLFSFFSKKPASKTAPTAKTKPASDKNIKNASSSTATSSSQPAASPSSPKPMNVSQSSPSSQASPPSTRKTTSGVVVNTKWKQIKISDRVSVYWPDDETYYPAQVTKQRRSSSTFFLNYKDGDTEWIDLSTEDFKILAPTKSDTSASAAGKPKRRRIDESDDEDEHEWKDDEASSDDDGSVFEAPKDEEPDEEVDDQWMVTDNEEDEEIAKPAKKKPRKAASSSLKITQHKMTPPTSASSPSATTSAASSTGSAFKTPLRQFANTVSPQTNSSQKFDKAKLTPPNPRPEITPVVATISSRSAAPGKTLMYTKGAVNSRGSHVHNHLKFLKDPKDSQGRRPGTAGYDSRTLQVRTSDWEQHVGKMTNAVQQWWDLKSSYFDTVLLFKTGKFYEMFHMDADAGVEVLGHNYMKGHIAHSGFPEISYGSMADKLVRAGFKVARVEQTETPDQLKVRKQRTKGKKPQVVNREVCSIMTLGTRTFCCLDDQNAFDNTATTGGCGPLLTIREVLVDSMETDSDADDQVQPVCEYGITLVDAVRATVTVGQFADDVLRSRMNTLLTTFSPSEILIQGGEEGASPTLQSLIKAYQTNSRTTSRVETIQDMESFPKSTALDANHRRQIERKTPQIHPWNTEETMDELHRRAYYPRGSKTDKTSVRRWPKVLKAVVDGKADLCLSSFGATLFYLQRNLIDQEILSMGIVKAYVPPASSCVSQNDACMDNVMQQSQQESQTGLEENPLHDVPQITNAEDQIRHMSLDGTTLHNLEILTNAVDHKVTGSLWSKINFTKTPHGSRLLRAWLLRPLFRKADIERRADGVQELVSGAGAVALNEVRQNVLSKVGDLDRLLSRVHSMSGTTANQGSDEGYHPGERAVLYESATYTKRKVGDFSKVLNGLRVACQLPEVFDSLELQNDGLLHKIVKLQKDGGCFPQMIEQLDWYFDNFDCEKASKGFFEPSRGVDQDYDDACDTVDRLKAELEDYKQEMCNELTPRHTAKNYWKYINVNPNSKDKYLIELPASVQVPDDFLVKGKRGSGLKQVNKYRTRFVAELIVELERALEIQAVRKAKGMQLIFAKFDSQRALWAAAAAATAMLDALGSLAKTAGKPGFCRPTILECPLDQEPTVNIVQGRHPCVETTVHSSEFIPNDLVLGRASIEDSSRLLLLSGPNMGGKSTLLRQTCLITILAQLGSYVPADSCELTPIDCIYTRLGASDRILLGQSTFFVELAETAAALRGATRRSLVIMDELGRGTSTFDGTAIAGATVKHLVDRSQCLTLFATHYHSLLDEWKDEPKVRLGHMQCMVEDSNDSNNGEKSNDHSITFLYTLGPGCCPKSFGINVARLASLPSEVLTNAKRVSEEFEEEMTDAHQQRPDESASVGDYKQKIMKAIQAGNLEEVERLWQELKQ